MPNETGADFLESQTRYERERDLRDYFWTVVNAYQQTCELSPLVAANPDPAIRPTKLCVDGIHYIADVELATRKALAKNPELIAQWETLVSGQNTPNSGSIIRRCARVYRARRLAPISYFRHVKKGRADRRPSVAVAQRGAA